MWLLRQYFCRPPTGPLIAIARSNAFHLDDQEKRACTKDPPRSHWCSAAIRRALRDRPAVIAREHDCDHGSRGRRPLGFLGILFSPKAFAQGDHRTSAG